MLTDPNPNPNPNPNLNPSPNPNPNPGQVLLTEGIVTELHRHHHSKIVATYVRTPLTWGVHVHSSAGYRDVDSLHRAEGGARFAVSRMGSGCHRTLALTLTLTVTLTR